MLALNVDGALWCAEEWSTLGLARRETGGVDQDASSVFGSPFMQAGDSRESRACRCLSSSVKLKECFAALMLHWALGGVDKKT